MNCTFYNTMTNVFHPLFLKQSYLFIYYFTGFCQVPHKVFLLVRVHKHLLNIQHTFFKVHFVKKYQITESYILFCAPLAAR